MARRGAFTKAANGGIFRSYADGGFNSAHIAAPTPGGILRYAEPETGGEAYIPLGSAKRGRSQMLVKQVARMFGGDVTGFADGGFNLRQPSRSLTSGGGPPASITINAPVTINGTPGEDVTRAVNKGIEQLEQSVKMEMNRR